MLRVLLSAPWDSTIIIIIIFLTATWEIIRWIEWIVRTIVYSFIIFHDDVS